MVRKCLVLLASTSMLGGCYSFRGPEPAFERGTVHHRDAVGPREGYLYEQFRRATLAASGCPEEPEPASTRNPVPIDDVCTPQAFASAAEKQEALDTFLDTGFSLIESDCRHYFAHMGRRQSGSRLAHDVVAPIGTLITGIISIVRFENSNTRDDLLASLALATTTGRAVLDVYDQNFLFGSDNISSVEELTLRSLAAHASTALEARHDTFGKSANLLEANQSKCRPPYILQLVRQAISAGDPEAKRSGVTTAAPAPAPAPAPVAPVAPVAPAAPVAGPTTPPARESISVSIPQ